MGKLIEQQTEMINVREANKDDVAAVYELIIAIAKHHDQEKYVKTSKEILLQNGFGENPLFGVLLAEKDGVIAGYVSYTWNYSIWLGRQYMNIDDVFVWEKFRGMNIGETLMLKAKEVCNEKGISKIKWEVQKDNHKAIRFYERLGAKLNVKGLFSWEFISS